MCSLIFLITILLSWNTLAKAEQCPSMIPTIVGSIFGTIAVVIIIFIITALLYKRMKGKQRENDAVVQGYDNPLVIADQEIKGINDSDDAKDVEKVTTFKTSSVSFDEASSQHKPENRVFTVLLDQKPLPTNGIDVLQDDVGDIVISKVKEKGPAKGKLKKGDVIESITVFFDSIGYEDALSLLSYSAPYKIAITVSHKENHRKASSEEPVPPSGAVPLHPQVTRVDGERQRTDDANLLSDEREIVIGSVEAQKASEKPVEEDKMSRDNCDSSSTSSSCSEDAVVVIQRESDPVEENKEEQEDQEKEEDTSRYVEDKQLEEKKSSDLEKITDSFAFIDENRDSSSSSSSPDSDSFHVVSPSQVPTSPTLSSDYDKLDDIESNRSPVEDKPKPSEEKFSKDDVKEDVVVPLETNPVLETPKKTPVHKREDIVFISGWRKAVKLLDLIRARLVLEETAKKLESGEVSVDDVAKDLHPYLAGDETIGGIIMMEDNTKLSLYDAAKKNILRRGTSVSLLEAQAATGSILNPYTGAKMGVREATQEGLIDPPLESVLIRAERAVLGYPSKEREKPLSLFEAMKEGFVMESHGIRLLEAQIATGGIIDPHANHRLPVEVAFERGFFDQRLNKILEDPTDDTRGFFDPNTNENLSYVELLERCIVDPDTSIKLLPIFKEKQKKGYWKTLH